MPDDLLKMDKKEFKELLDEKENNDLDFKSESSLFLKCQNSTPFKNGGFWHERKEDNPKRRTTML